MENNLILATILGASAGVLSGFVFKFAELIPKNIYILIKRKLTTTYTMTEFTNTYNNFIKYLDKNNLLNKCKNLRAVRHGVLPSIGNGIESIKIKGCRCFLEGHTLNLYDNELHKITLYFIGNKKKILSELLNELGEIDKPENSITTTISSSFEDYLNYIPKRDFSNVFIKKNDEAILTKRLDFFVHNEDKYNELGIPYQLGILLYGEAGTGKTSVTKAIANYLNKEIQVVESSQIGKIGGLINYSSNKIIVIEDIDSFKITHSRDKNSIKDLESSTESNNLSNLLNNLDGFLYKHGRIIIATTNHFNKLDTALVRSGRFDLKINIGYADREIVNKFSKKYYNKELPKNIELKNNITISDLQSNYFNGDSFNLFLNKIELKKSLNNL